MKRSIITALVREVLLYAGSSVWSGIREEAKNQGLDLIVILGGILGKEGSIVYDLMTSDRIGGVINWSASDSNDFLRFFKHRLNGKPMMCLTLPVDDLPVVRGNASTGIKEAVHHMVTVHGCKKFLCVQGRQTVSTFRERYDAFMEAIEEAGLPKQNVIVVEPIAQDMSLSYGERLVGHILDERKLKPGVDFQAIFGPSENVILGLLREIQRRGVRVPQDTAIISIDNSYISRGDMPKLTAVINPIEQTGSLAVRLLRQQIEGQVIPPLTILNSALVINNSCGCISDPVMRAGLHGPILDPKQRSARKSVKNQLTGDQAVPELLAKITTHIRGHYARADNILASIEGLINRLVKTVLSDIQKETAADSLNACDFLAHTFVEQRLEMQILQDIVSVILANGDSFLEDQKSQARLIDIVDKLRVQISEAVVYTERSELTRYENNFMRLRELIMAVSATFEFNELCKQLTNYLPALGIADFFIVLYETRKQYDFLEPISVQSRLRFGYHKDKIEELDADGILFPTADILPEAVLPKGRLDMTVAPLMFKGIQLGYMVANGGPYDRILYATLAGQISNVVRGDILMKEQQVTENQLSITLDNLHEKAAIVKVSSNAISDEVGDASAAMHEVATNIKSISNLTVMINKVVQTAVDQAALADNKVRLLDDQLKKISEVTAIISDIAELTNVLSINAGIQAARAHEAGKGFGIVAQEVRQLAEGTGHSAENINHLIKQVNEFSSNVIEAIRSMSEVVGQVDTLSAQIQDAISQQTVASDEISQRLVHVSERSITISDEIAKLASD